jgi:hypothetical protein
MSQLIKKYNLSIKKENIDFIQKSADYFDEINTTYLLKINNEEFNILEKVVYDIAVYHLLQLNIEFDINTHFIEFGVHNKGTHNFKINTSMSNGNQITPFFSSILYLTENDEPNDNMVFTNINLEKYIYKEFGDDIDLYMSFPKKCQQIIFDGGSYYYASNLLNNITLSVNIWNIFPYRVTYFDINIFNYLMYTEKKEEIFNDPKNIIKKNMDSLIAPEIDYTSIPIIGTSELITDDFLETAIYEKVVNDNERKIYENLIKLITVKHSIVLFKRIVYKDLDIIETISQRINIEESKFIQRLIFQNKFQKDVCNWIISECERYAINIENWKYEYNTRILQIENIPSIFSFILDSFIDTSKTICNGYTIDFDEHIFNIENIYVSKMESNTNDKLDSPELFYDSYENDIILNILLNDDFEKGGKLFDDGITTYLKKGDMILFNGKTKSKNLNISAGLQYFLVAYININKK